MIGKNIDVAAQSAMYAGAGGSVVVWGLSLPDWAAIVSMALAMLGFIVHIVSVVRHDIRAERKLRLEERRGKEDVAGRAETHGGPST